jgi:hypothetical protein
MPCCWMYLFFCVPFQIPKSNSTVIGRLVAQVAETPSSRWLVSFENYKDEQYAEEMLGRVVGRMEEDASEDDREISPTVGGGLTVDDAAVNNSIETGTRSTKRRSTSQSGSSTSKTSPGDAISSAESSPAEDVTTEVKRKKKGVTFSSRSRSNSEVSIVPSPSREPQVTTTAVLSGSSLEISSNKVSDREQRSRRRQAISQEEAFQASLEASNDLKLNSNYKRFLTGGVSKNPSGGPKNKKLKLGSVGGKGGGDVLKVKLLTGTLFLTKGIHRHVEFIPRI